LDHQRAVLEQMHRTLMVAQAEEVAEATADHMQAEPGQIQTQQAAMGELPQAEMGLHQVFHHSLPATPFFGAQILHI
jgi:hypothetical protein